MKSVIFLLALVLSATAIAQQQYYRCGRCNRLHPVKQSQSSSKPSEGLSMYSGTDQQRCQAEANYMAARGIRGHVGRTIGRFEGCGWSTGGTPSTCVPGRSMRLTGDAIARSRFGVFRVRSWR